MRNMKTRVGRWAPMLVVPAMVLALAGCSGDDEPGEAGSGDNTSATDAPTEGDTTSKPPSTSPPDLEALPTVGQAEGALSDIEYDTATCSTEPGEATIEGTVTNPTDDPQGYLIAFSWTTATGDVLGRSYTIVRGAKPGKKTDWTVEGEVPADVTMCVPFVQRGVIKK